MAILLAVITVSLLLDYSMASRVIKPQKRIALVAHNKRKEELVAWAEANRAFLIQHQLVATGTTGDIIEKKLEAPVEKLLTGPLGGDQQLGAMIAEGRLDVILFFWDPLEAQPHDSDVKALIRLAVAWNIIIACNKTTADFIVSSALMNEDYTAPLPETDS
ncbi:MAG TPA: methylglyoxal synthase [Flavisolibacter sp.]|nr:methylglyoxal synthase [Flavisolibacter sp.]